MHKPKPVIGITGPVNGGLAAWLFTAFAVWAQGGKPVRIYPGKRLENITLDGLILGGGADINPGRYGELLEDEIKEKAKPKGFSAWIIRIISILFYPLLFLFRNIFSAKATGTESARDELEFSLLNDACCRGIPILGICRGMQLINVKFGGSLYQDISGFYTEVPKVHTIWPRKTVKINEESTLFQIINASSVLVNALHHQAVDQLGETMMVTAKEDNGVIQGIEHPGYDYLLGVQWHPEYLPQIPLQRCIFRALVQKAERSSLNQRINGSSPWKKK